MYIATGFQHVALCFSSLSHYNFVAAQLDKINRTAKGVRFKSQNAKDAFAA